MENEWPEAPRLKQSLEAVANSTEIGPQAREQTLSVLETSASVGFSDPTAGRRRNVGAWLAVTAAAVVLIAVASLGLRTNAMVSTSEDGSIGGVPESSSTTVLAVPVLEGSGDACRYRGEADLRPVRLDAGGPIVGLAVSSTPGSVLPKVGFISVQLDGHWETMAEQQRLHRLSETPDVIATYYGWDGTEPPTTLFRMACGNYALITTGTDLTLACPDARSVAPTSYAFVSPGGAPPSCFAVRPTIVVEIDVSDGQLDAWAARYGCLEPAIRIDDAGNRITTFESCDATLIFVESVESDPWNSTIDGVSAPEFVGSVVDIAN